MYYDKQYTNIAKQSTIHPILHLLKDSAHANDKRTKDHTMAVFLDLSKAFYTINDDILLYKSHFYGIRGISNTWFPSYLSNLKQYSEIHKCQSSQKHNKWNTTRIHTWTTLISNLYFMISSTRRL